MISPSKKGV